MLFIKTTWSRKLMTAPLITNVVYIFIFILFGIGAYLWAFQVYRTQSLAINPVLYPQFTEIDTSDLCCLQESYYKLWRIYDWIADGYALERHNKEHVRVPLVYVHGNGGSFFCARSLARFIYEANVRQRVKALQAYRQRVKTGIYELLEQRKTEHEFESSNNNNNNNNNSKNTVKLNDWSINSSYNLAALQHRVEHEVVHHEMPLLGLELFSIDFLEESNTQSGTITIKEARFINHSLHVLMHNFVQTYKDVLTKSDNLIPHDEVSNSYNTKNKLKEEEEYEQEQELKLSIERNVRFANNAELNSNFQHPRKLVDAHTKSKPYPIALVETEYINSICNNRFFKSSNLVCSLGRQLANEFSTEDRVRAEVKRIKENGFWVWGESLGGAVTLLAALLSPQLVEGIVYVGTPLHYPPLLFNDLSTKLYTVIARSILFRSIDQVEENTSVINIANASVNHVDNNNNTNIEELKKTGTSFHKEEESAPMYNASPITLIDWLYNMKDEALLSRLSSVTMLSINGGALDDVIPSTASYLHRSIPREHAANFTMLRQTPININTNKMEQSHLDSTITREGIFWDSALHATDNNNNNNNKNNKNENNPTSVIAPEHLLLKEKNKKTALHRDISTEVLRGCGLPMDHRGVVYGSQFLETSANSLVDAALLPDANAHFAFENALPSLHRDRLFASVTEVLPYERYSRQRNAFEFAQKLSWTENGSIVYDAHLDSHMWHKVCSKRSSSILLEELEEWTYVFDNNVKNSSNSETFTDAEESYYHGRQALNIFLGVTTYAPEEVNMPSLQFYEKLSNGQFVLISEADLTVNAVTKLHLPFLRKDGKPKSGQTLRTAVSFNVHKLNKVEEESQPERTVKEHRYSEDYNATNNRRLSEVWPEFCFLVSAESNENTESNKLHKHATREHYSFVQHDRVDPREFVKARQPIYLGPIYIGNKLRVEKHTRYVLIDGIDSTMQERQLSINTHRVRHKYITNNNTVLINDNNTTDSKLNYKCNETIQQMGNKCASDNSTAVGMLATNKHYTFPITLCGSLHSFFLTMRGNNNVAIDEPLEQIQYFFGPFHSLQESFNYSWQPHRTFPWNWNETYIVYTINDMSFTHPSEWSEWQELEQYEWQSEFNRHERNAVQRNTSMLKGEDDNCKVKHKKHVNDIVKDFNDKTAVESLITLHDFEQLAALPYWSLARLRLIIIKWPEHLLSFFSANSEIGKMGGSYIIYYLCLILLTGVLEEHFYIHTALRKAEPLKKEENGSNNNSNNSNNNNNSEHDSNNDSSKHRKWRLLHWLRTLHPITKVTLYAVLFELLSSLWVTHALSVCTSPELPSLTLKEASSLMRWKEKFTLMLFYGVWPDARICRYSWIRMQTINEGPTLLCKVESLYVGFCMAALLMSVVYAVFWIIRMMAYAFHWHVTKRLIVNFPKWAALWLTAMWLTPFVVLFTPMFVTSLPLYPLSYVYVFATCWAHSLLSITPSEVAPGYNFQWPCTLLCIVSLAPAHFEGLILTIRNHVKLHLQGADNAFWDRQRQAVTLYECVIFVLVQLSLATVYFTCYYITLHTYSRETLAKHTNGECKVKHNVETDCSSLKDEIHDDDIHEMKQKIETITSRAINGNNIIKKNHDTANNNKKQTSVSTATSNNHRTTLCANNEAADGHYNLGEINRKHTWLSCLLCITERTMLVLLIYTTLVVMRRPLEGDIVLLDIVFHLFYLSCFVLRRL